MSWPPSVPFNLQWSFRATVWCVSHDGVMEVLIAWALQAKRDNPLVKGNIGGAPVWREGYFLFVREISECYLTFRYPPILLNNVGHRLKTAMCWFVIQTDKLNSSVQVCLAGSPHDYVTLLQVHNSSLISMMGFLILCQAYSLFLLSFCKKINHDKNTKTQNVHCHAYQIVCSALSFFVSQVNTVKYIQWMIFNSYPLLVVQCNTLETLSVCVTW